LPRDRSSHKLVASIDDVSRCLRIVDNVDKEKHQQASYDKEVNKMIQKSASGISNDPEIDDLIVDIKRRISINHKRDEQPELSTLKQGNKHNKKPNKIRDSSHTSNSVSAKATQKEEIYAQQYEFGIVDKMGNQKNTNHRC